jgi:hypothetical protein
MKQHDDDSTRHAIGIIKAHIKAQNEKTLTPEALAWLAGRLPMDSWQRVLDLRGISLDAVFAYVRNIADEENYQEFLDLNYPEVAAERKKKEQEAAEAARKESLTLHNHLPKLSLEDGLLTGAGWRSAELTEAERREAEKTAEEERTGMRLIPEAVV